MKSVATQTKGQSASRRAAGRAPAQARARQGAGNRHRADAFERQAQEIAAAVMRNEKGAGLLIHPREPAGYRAAESYGSPLPQSVREKLEAALGADLRSVRIHTSAAADKAVQDAGADAFASGRDIYFRAGFYSPHTPSGRELLTHEIVHVLQQTGRRNEKDVLVASARSGSGKPQYQGGDDSPHADSLVPFLADGADPLAALTKRHHQANLTDESLNKLIQAASKLAPGKFPRKSDTAAGDWLIKTANDGKFTDDQTGAEYTLSIPAQGFLIDCLKLCDQEKHYEAAVALLDADKKNEIQTAYAARSDFRKYLLDKKDEQWFSGAFKHPSLQKVWPWVYLDTFAQFFLNPGRDIQELYGLTELKQKDFKNLDGKDETLLPSDRVILALELVVRYDDTRQSLLAQLRKMAEDQIPEAPAVNKRYALAQLMRTELESRLKQPQPEFWSSMLTEMLRITNDAVKLWGDVIAADDALSNAFEDADLLSGLATFTRPVSGDYDSLKPLRTILSSIDKIAEAGGKGKPVAEPGLLYLEIQNSKPIIPTPPQYAKRIEALDRMLGLRSNVDGNVLLTLQSRLVQLSMQKKLPSDEATAIGWTIFTLQQFKQTLLAYDPKKDQAQYPDTRLQHRRTVARFLIGISQALAWAEVQSIGASVVLGEDFPSSYLIVPGEWTRNDNAPIEELTTDFAADEPFESVPLTPRELALFFSGQFLLSVQKLVQAEVDRVNTTPAAKLEAENVNKRILALPRPWRIDPPPEMQKVIRQVDLATIDSQTLIEGNAWSIAEIKRLGAESNLGSSPPWVSKKRKKDAVGAGPTEIFAWILPDLKPLIQQLQKSEPFKTRMAGVTAANEFDWLSQLLKTTGAGGKTVRQEIDDTLKTYAEEGQNQARSAMRQFTILNRRKFAEAVRKKLNKFINDSSVTNFAIPYQFANDVVRLASVVVPSIEEKQQTGLFLLDLAPEIGQAFSSLSGAGRLQPYLLTYFKDAVAFAKEASEATKAGAEKKVTDYYEQFLYKNPKDPKQDESLATLVGNASQLTPVIAAMEQAAKDLQLMFGFLSRDGSTLQSVLIGPAIDLTPMHLLNPFRDTPLVNDPRIRPGERYAMEIDGNDWELVQVHRKFFYHPALSTAVPGSPAATAVLVDDQEKDIPQGTLLMTFLINGEEKKIAAGDNDLLKKLSDEVFNATLVQKLEQMGAEIEEDMNFLMDIVELIPGAGQEFAVARATAMTVGAIAAGQYDEIFKMVKEDPVGYVKKIAENLIDRYLTVEGVLTFIVLGQSGIDWSKWRKPSDPARAPSTSNPPRGKLARLLAFLRRLGARIANALAWIQLRTAPLLRSVQSSLATRPRVGWLLRRSFDIATWLINLIPPGSGTSPASGEERRLAALRDLASVDPQAVPQTAAPAATTAAPATPAEAEIKSLQSMLGPVGDGIAAAAAEFKKQLEDLLDELQQMELPQEIFPDAVIIGIITDFVLVRLGAKVKFAYKALKAVGLIDKINAAVADKLKGTPGDPNYYWQTYVLTKVDDEFHELRNSAVESIYGITNNLADETGLSFLSLGPPPLVDKSDFKIQKAPFPESELFRSPQRVVSPLRGVEELPEGSGLPLPTDLRRRAERHFGHDFGHVRFHADTGSQTMLKAVGAEALTSGSHVYLSADQQLDDSAILRHELTHVLQQTGERPLGFDHSPQPLPGRPGLGIRLYPERESEADNYARQRPSARKPARVRGAAGMQPTGLDQGLLDKVIHAFTEVDSAKDFEKTAGAAVPGKETADKFWSALLHRIESPNLVEFKDCFKGVAADILTYLKHAGMDQEVAKVAALAQQPVAAGKQKRKTASELNFSRFVTLFEGALLGKTGIVAQITAKEKPAVEVTKVEIGYLHFGAISTSSKEGVKLWSQVVANTSGLPSSTNKELLYNEIFAWLHGIGVQAFIWNYGSSAFRFSEDFVTAFGKTRKTQIAGKLPGKAEYLNESGSTGIGLRIGKHSGQKGEQRESHHTTQYLLVQFFRNDNSNKAWQSGKDYPGIEPKTGNGRKKFQMNSSTELGLYKLDSDNSKRGADMPAILISKDLHRRGQLHIERESEWSGNADDPDSDSGQGRATQGYSIRNQFQRGLLKEFKVTDDAPEWNKTMAANPVKGAEGIGKAMLGTYRWMNSIMMTALERGLATRELAYYNAMAARQGMGDRLTVDDMKGVFQKTKTNNDSVMQAENWTLS